METPSSPPSSCQKFLLKSRFVNISAVLKTAGWTPTPPERRKARIQEFPWQSASYGLFFAVFFVLIFRLGKSCNAIGQVLHCKTYSFILQEIRFCRPFLVKECERMLIPKGKRSQKRPESMSHFFTVFLIEGTFGCRKTGKNEKRRKTFTIFRPDYWDAVFPD